MAVLIQPITDELGEPLNGVILTSGEYNTSPVPFGYSATTGPGSGGPGTLAGTTAGNGTMTWNIPYTCVGHWTGVWKADGYDDYPWDYTSGYVTGNIEAPTIAMVQTETTTGTPASGNTGANNDAGDKTDQKTATSAGNQETRSVEGSNWAGAIEQWWWLIAILAVVAVVLLAYFVRHTGIAPLDNATGTIRAGLTKAAATVKGATKKAAVAVGA
jgi:hypothetical protein